MRLDAGSEEEAVVNLVPLLDVMFLLLIFFLVSTTFTKDEVDMNLVLPEARSGAPAESGNLLVINVAQDGAITVDGRQVATMEALRQKLRAAASRNRDQQVLIRGDTRAIVRPQSRRGITGNDHAVPLNGPTTDANGHCVHVGQ